MTAIRPLLAVRPLLAAGLLCVAAPAFGQRGAGAVRPVIDVRSPATVPPAFPTATRPAAAQSVPAPPPIPLGPRPTPAPRPVAPVAPPAAARVPAAATPILVGVRPGGPRAPRSMQALSLTHISLPETRAIAVHDIITILVDEKSEVAVQSRFDRRRNATLEANIDEFVRLDPTGRLILSATGDPSIDLSAGVRTQANGAGVDTEAVRYRIAAEVVDVLPNGNVVLEARKQIRSNRDMWEYTLTGTIAAEKVRRDMTALSEDVATLKIEKDSKGKVYDSTRRAWGVRALDWMWPF